MIVSMSFESLLVVSCVVVISFFPHILCSRPVVVISPISGDTSLHLTDTSPFSEQLTEQLKLAHSPTETVTDVGCSSIKPVIITHRNHIYTKGLVYHYTSSKITIHVSNV